MTQPTILIVEDDPTLMRGLTDNFRSQGYRVQTATDGQQGLDAALGGTPPDLIVLDIMLPRVNGYEVSRMIKQKIQEGALGKDIAVLIVTARKTDSEEREEFLQTWSKADEFIYKPFDLDHLSERIMMFLSSADSTGQEPSDRRSDPSKPGREVKHVEEVRSGD